MIKSDPRPIPTRWAMAVADSGDRTRKIAAMVIRIVMILSNKIFPYRWENNRKNMMSTVIST